MRFFLLIYLILNEHQKQKVLDRLREKNFVRLLVQTAQQH